MQAESKKLEGKHKKNINKLKYNWRFLICYQ